MVYRYLLHGGPKDGEIMHGVHPYHELRLPGGIVYASTLQNPHHLRWIADGQYEIDLHFQEDGGKEWNPETSQ